MKNNEKQVENFDIGTHGTGNESDAVIALTCRKGIGCDNALNFEWNSQKAEINLKKHGISFNEAKTVFDDPLYVDFYDPDHSDTEHRYLIIGQSCRERLLIVSYTERENIYRLISARKTTRTERKDYENG